MAKIGCSLGAHFVFKILYFEIGIVDLEMAVMTIYLHRAGLYGLISNGSRLVKKGVVCFGRVYPEIRFIYIHRIHRMTLHYFTPFK